MARSARLASLPESHFWSLTPAEVDEIINEAVDEWRARERAADYREARLEAALYNCHRDPKKHPEPFTAEDILPGLRPSKPEPTQAEVAAKARSAMKTFQALIPE